jgi:hypothetical protein
MTSAESKSTSVKKEENATASVKQEGEEKKTCTFCHHPAAKVTKCNVAKCESLACDECKQSRLLFGGTCFACAVPHCAKCGSNPEFVAPCRVCRRLVCEKCMVFGGKCFKCAVPHCEFCNQNLTSDSFAVIRRCAECKRRACVTCLNAHGVCVGCESLAKNALAIHKAMESLTSHERKHRCEECEQVFKEKDVLRCLYCSYTSCKECDAAGEHRVKFQRPNLCSECAYHCDYCEVVHPLSEMVNCLNHCGRSACAECEPRHFFLNGKCSKCGDDDDADDDDKQPAEKKLKTSP